MAPDQANTVKEVQSALRRLGWLSAYSRQILLTRHLLRNLAAISHPDEIPRYIPGEFALHIFRCSITVLAGVNRDSQQFSSPYDPVDRPETHHLAYNRKERIFGASIASGMPDVQFYYGAGNSFGFENSTEVTLEDGLFCHEVQTVAKGISLTNKALADQRAEVLRNEKLWRGFASEDETDAAKFFDNWYEWVGKAGAFWREWYQGFVDGRPLDWDLQRRVALIENSIWEAGPDAVAEEIEKIRAKFKLEEHIAELEDELEKSTASRHGIGGNLPPEPLEDTHIAQELVIIIGPVEELKDEIAKDDLDPSRLQKIIEALVAALKTGLVWCLKKADLMVDSAIKWAIPAGAGYLALNPEKIEAVITAARKLLGLL